MVACGRSTIQVGFAWLGQPGTCVTAISKLLATAIAGIPLNDVADTARVCAVDAIQSS
jgi:hypothetical protein